MSEARELSNRPGGADRLTEAGGEGDGRRVRHRIAAVGVVAAFALAACGGDDDASSTSSPEVDVTTAATTSTTAPATATTEAAPATTQPTTATTAPDESTATTEPVATTVIVTSEDGNLTLEVDAADADRVDPTLRALDPSEWPPELGDADQLPGVTIYEMGPDGAEFDVPVVVTRRLDMASFDDAVDAGSVPLVVPFTQTADGQFVPLDDLEVTRIGSELFASGTTTHFSPLGTIDIQMDVRFIDATSGPGLELDSVDFGPFDHRFPNADFSTIAQGPAAAIEALAGTTPEVVSRAANPPSGFPGFGPVVVGAVERRIPTQTAAEDSRSLYSLLADSDEVPTSPLFDGPEPPETLSIAVRNYIASVESGADRDESARLREIAEQIAAEAGLEFGVVHTPFGNFPSYATIRVYGTPELEQAHLIAALYTGEIGPEAKLIDIAPLEPNGDGLEADLGLASYGDVNTALILVPEGRGFDDLSAADQWESIMSLPGDLIAMFVPDSFTVTAAEGVLFEGEDILEFYLYP